MKTGLVALFVFICIMISLIFVILTQQLDQIFANHQEIIALKGVTTEQSKCIIDLMDTVKEQNKRIAELESNNGKK